MTLGNRLNALRTKRGLSQLELAEALEVSRQSVSKWETDAAVPENDKLVALIRFFGVSVGALLGVEPEDPAPEVELSEAQLRTVEEIVSRYADALPKPLSKRRRALLGIAGAIAAVWLVCMMLLLNSLSQRLGQQEQNYADLSDAVQNVTQNVAWQIDGVTNRVEEVLKSQNNLTANYSTEVVDTDPRGGTVTFLFRVKPKTLADGMIAYLEVENDGAQVRFGPYAPQEETFSGKVTVALTDSTALYVVFETDGKRETQLLDRYDGLYTDTMPDMGYFHIDDDLLFDDLPGGRLTRENWFVPVGDVLASETMARTAERGTHAAAERIELGLFRNRRLVAWAEELDRTPENYYGYDNATFYRFAKVDLPLAVGDELALILRVTDEYSRVAMFRDAGECFCVTGEGGALRLNFSEAARGGWSAPSEWGLA